MVSARTFAIRSALLILVNLAVHAAFAAPGDENWDTAFGLPGVHGTVETTVTYGGGLVVGGLFDSVGGLAVGNLARWDGTQWSTMGDPFDAEVLALAVWNGELYAGGWFTGGLARWDGSAWVDVDGGVDGGVEGFAEWNGALVIAGDFIEVGGGALGTAGVVLWDGVDWIDLGGGLEGSAKAAAVYGGSLYVCGQFEYAGGDYAGNIARWNGSAWSALGSGLTDDVGDAYNAYGTAMVVQGGKLVVGGMFAEAGGVAVEGLAAWNGTSFSGVGTPSLGGEVYALGLRGTDLVASGDFGSVEAWNGAFWSTLGSVAGYVNSLDEHLGDLIVGGAFSQVYGSGSASGLAAYDGSWSALAQGQGVVGTVECIHEWNGTPVVGGAFQRAGEVTGVIAAWDGSAWTPLGGGIPGTFGARVEAMTTFEGDLVAAGAFTTAGGVAANKIARWDGAQWSAMGAGSAATVSGLQVLDGVLYANGYWSGQQTLGRWNGSDFDPLGTGVAGGVQILYGLGSYQGDPVMGGGFTSVDGVPANNIARWNGTTWQALGVGTSGAVFAIHEVGGLLYVGGVFTQAGGQPAANVAVWNGSAWSALGAGVNGRVFSIASVGSDVYVTGEFTQAGGQPAAHIARWDGAAWHALGSGLDDDGHGLALIGAQLWAGGAFTTAGTSGSLGVARWQTGGASAAPLPVGPSRIALRPAWPNPFTASTTLAFTLPEAADVTVDVYDVRGARVRSLVGGALSAGSHAVTWDGRDRLGRPAPSGVYVMAVRDGVSAARRSVVLTR
ncbi:MAG TPA: FlgD immunoglobulin-like domain containing protein [Candidatus Krumholzibacteria bacterium]|nr:FlgD immunoglobulin-like domain containing protein [Candidatus Krumholzibacteria bacterium]